MLPLTATDEAQASSAEAEQVCDDQESEEIHNQVWEKPKWYPR